MQPGAGQQGGPLLRGNYGIYLVDAFGNRELIYRDPEIGCLSPIPLRPRPLPPRGTRTRHARRRHESGDARRSDGRRSRRSRRHGGRDQRLRQSQSLAGRDEDHGAPRAAGVSHERAVGRTAA